MKKKISLGISIIQVVLVIGAYLVQRFAETRMGMMRHVVFKNREWETQLPIDMIKLGIVVFLVGLIALMIIKYFRRKETMNLSHTTRVVSTIILSLMLIGYVLFLSTSDYISYYYMGMIFILVVGLDYVKTYKLS